MTCRRTPGIADGFLVMGLAVTVIGLMAITSGLADSAAIRSFAAERIAAPINSVSPMTPLFRSGHRDATVAISPDPPRVFPTPPSTRSREQDDRGGQGDARIDVQDVAATAQRYPWAGLWHGETRTDRWVNAPRSIGSTSPPDVGPVIPSGDACTARNDRDRDLRLDLMYMAILQRRVPRERPAGHYGQLAGHNVASDYLALVVVR